MKSVAGFRAFFAHARTADGVYNNYEHYLSVIHQKG